MKKGNTGLSEVLVAYPTKGKGNAGHNLCRDFSSAAWRSSGVAPLATGCPISIAQILKIIPCAR